MVRGKVYPERLNEQIWFIFILSLYLNLLMAKLEKRIGS